MIAAMGAVFVTAVKFYGGGEMPPHQSAHADSFPSRGSLGCGGKAIPSQESQSFGPNAAVYWMAKVSSASAAT